MNCRSALPNLLLTFCIFLAGAAGARDAEARQQGRSAGAENLNFGGPASVEGELEEDAVIKKPAFRFPAVDFKQGLHDRHGLEIAFHYSALYQGASEHLAGREDEAASGILRTLGRWTVLNRDGKNKGALVFSFDHRNRIGTEVAPADLGFEAGYLGIPGTLFSNPGWVLVDLNWQQYVNDGQTAFIAGRYDPNDYLDVLGYANPWTAFQNLAIFLNSSIALPDLSIGLGAGHWFTDQWYGLATINDANGVVTELDAFDDGGEFYKSAEIGWSPSRDERYTHNVHMTAWHADQRDDAGIEESWGVTAGLNWTFTDTWMPFLRAGWSDGAAPLVNATLTAGLLHYRANRSDLIGLAFNWGDPADDALREQYTAEMFYRFQLAQNLAITPSIQLLLDPALNPKDDQVLIAGLRLRLTL